MVEFQIPTVTLSLMLNTKVPDLLLKIIIFSFKVYNYSNCEEMYTINLDLWKYGMSRDESICIYTNQVFEIPIVLNT